MKNETKNGFKKLNYKQKLKVSNCVYSERLFTWSWLLLVKRRQGFIIMAEKYEPYEKPSAVPGIAITGAGIGALAYLARRKIPGLKILEKIAKTKTPPPPATRITPQVVDKVTETTKIS